MAVNLMRKSFYLTLSKQPQLGITFSSNLLKSDSHQYLRYPRFLAVNRKMSSDSPANIVNIDCKQLAEFQKDPKATIIDVREPSELKETGVIPSSVNIPLATLKEALQKEDENFQKTYSKAKPLKENPIVFSCRSGRRSFMAAEEAASLGYKKVFNFAGGWIEYENECKTQQ